MDARIEIENMTTLGSAGRSAVKSTGCGPATTRRKNSWDGRLSFGGVEGLRKGLEQTIAWIRQG